MTTGPSTASERDVAVDRRPFHSASGGSVVRALRLPFCSASVIPYVAGAFLASGPTRWGVFVLGLIAVIATHLSANLINDVADDANTVDRQDPRYFGFFGGSQLIQEGHLSRGWYARAGVVLGVAAGVATAVVAWLTASWEILLYFAGILVMGWSYSHGPARLSARGLGELVIFLLFGPACVVGGAYLQEGGWPGNAAWWVSLPMGLLTMAILLANEVPDGRVDAAGGKRTLVVRLGRRRAWMLLALVLAGTYAGVVASVVTGALNVWALLAVGTVPLALAIVRRVRRFTGPREAFVPISRAIIALQLITGLLLLPGAVR